MQCKYQSPIQSRYKSTALALVLLFQFSTSTEVALAQDTELPSCSSAAFDPDGDGYGFDIYRGSSCVVTSETSTAPQYTNLETNQPVVLERTYWDGNKDLVNRDISCQDFTWSADRLTYEAGEATWFRFAALPSEAPWIAHYWKANSQEDLGTNYAATLMWSVDSGIFTDRTDHWYIYTDGFQSTRWIEPITTTNGTQAIRFWSGQSWSSDFPLFRECLDPTGEPLRATGHWDVPPTNLESAYVNSPLTFSGQQEPMPDMINKQTGQKILFETGNWELQRDLVYRSILCTPFAWKPAVGEYRTNDYNGVSEIEFQPSLISEGANSGWLWAKYDGVRNPGRWSIDGQTLSGSEIFANSMWFEPISNSQLSASFLLEQQEGEQFQGVRYWGQPGQSAEDRSNSYRDCYAIERPPRGIYSFNDGFSRRINFRPGSVDEAPANVVSNNDFNDQDGSVNQVDSDGIDSNSSSNNDTNSDSQVNAGDDSSADDLSNSGGGSMNMFVLLAGILMFRTRRILVREICC